MSAPLSPQLPSAPKPQPTSAESAPPGSSSAQPASSAPTNGDDSRTATSPAKSRDLPLPPRLPSMKDVSVWPSGGDATSVSTKPDDTSHVAWTRTTSPTPTAAPAVPTKPLPAPQPGKLAKVRDIIRRMPDPTLLFLLEAAILLLLHTTQPHLLRTWAARLIAPAALVPTVAAAALWRPTRIVPVPGRPVAPLGKPVPNAAKVVAVGETLRARERALLVAEDELRTGQLKLEVLRKEIERRLPPTVSIANLLESERSNATPL